MNEVGPHVLFVGLGRMGGPMARRLVAAGYTVTPRDLDPEVVAAWPHPVDDGARAEVVLLMLTSSVAVRSVLEGDGVTAGLLGTLDAGTVVIDMGSSDPVATRELAASAAAAGIGYVDAPVTGGVVGAVSGDLTVMVGGADEDVDRVGGLLSCLGQRVLRTGGVGTGHAMKALNNLVSAAGMLATAEAMTAGVRFGLAPQTILDVLNVGSGRTYASERKLAQFVLSGRFDSGFALDLMLKDVGTARALQVQLGTPSLVSQACAQEWAAAAAALPGADHTEFIEWVAGRAGVDLVVGQARVSGSQEEAT